MTLIIEDGSIVTNANSFTTDAELQAYALARGNTLPSTESERDQLQIKAVDYIFSIETKLKGCRVSASQALPYPRFDVSLYGFALASDEIPQALKNAQMELAIQVQASDLLISQSVQNVSKEKLDTLEVEYFNGGSWAHVRTDAADAYLNPLYKNNGNTNIMTRV